MKPLILVKHSMPEVVKDIPAREWHLSEDGRVRAQRLANLLVAYRPDVVVSSLEPKAVQTAEITAKQLGLPYQAVANLHEHDRSASPHYSKDEFQQLVREFFAQPNDLIFGSETAIRALERFHMAIDELLNQYEGKTVVVVAHGTVISLFAEWLTGCNGYDLWRVLDLPSFVVLNVATRQLLETINLT